MATYSWTSSSLNLGSGSSTPGIGSWCYLSDKNGATKTPKGTNITATFTCPTSIPWSATKITSGTIATVHFTNGSSAGKSGSYCFRTGTSGSYNGNVATGNGVSLWYQQAWWIPANDSKTVNVTLNANDIAYIQSRLSSGNSIYFSVFEGRTTSPGNSTTYHTQTKYEHYTLTLNYDYTSNTQYYTGSKWQPVMPQYWNGSKWQQCQLFYWNGSKWQQC